MSTGAGETLDDGRAIRWSSAGFVLLLTLSVLWPAPVLWINGAFFQAPLSVHEDSFLGREAPSWDVVFWGIAALLALAMLHARVAVLSECARTFTADLRRLSRGLRGVPRRVHPWRTLLLLLIGSAVVALVWLQFDVRVIAATESVQSEMSRLIVRLLNRLGGGMNPLLIALFFGFAGFLYKQTRWTELAVCMLMAGGLAGLMVQILKFSFGRSRPELWLGAFHHTWPSATSFPSGHTVGAFAIAGVIFFGARTALLRSSAMVLAFGIAISRVLAFRHWPSDVIASAILGTWVAWIFTAAMLGADETADQMESSRMSDNG